MGLEAGPVSGIDAGLALRVGVATTGAGEGAGFGDLHTTDSTTIAASHSALIGGWHWTARVESPDLV
jgi:hypothetical protein